MCIINWLKELFNPIHRITKEDEIKEALRLVHKYTMYILEEYSIKIKWADLDSYSGTNVFACRATDSFGNNYILLNIRYKKAPAEQLASLITHETCHLKPKADLKEEIYATSLEASTWKELKKDIDYEETPLYKRLEKISVMSYEEITAYIKDSNFYERVLSV